MEIMSATFMPRSLPVSQPHAIIIDDHMSNIEVLRMMLEREGVTASYAQMPYQVPDVIEAAPRIDVIFLDLDLPDGDYYRLLNDLKRNSRLYRVPIIAYTVHTSEIDAARQAGFDGFLGKPLHLREFPDQLRRILSGEGVWAY
jgi:two-component system, cell cycle response regulator DivK